MKMKKTISAVILALMCGAGTASAAEALNVCKASVGYEGVFAGNVLQGLSTRYWFTKNIGSELNVYYGSVGVDSDSEGIDAKGDLFLASAKVLYAPVVKDHSKFYLGLEGGIGSIGAKNDGDDVLPGSLTVYTYGPLVGAEFSFAEIPELGINWEVGYKFHNVNYSHNDTDIDVNLNGTYVSLGAHYYF
ncbi:MAG TPA: outer membrane beta-barrel protein [Chlorobaculum sp.]|nr:outer membrane beta-barrel protein [Chlorobaculum sp.]